MLALQGLWRMVQVLLGGGLLALLLGWLWEPPSTVPLRFDLAVMQLQTATAVAAAFASPENIPTGLLLLVAIPTQGMLTGLRGRFLDGWNECQEMMSSLSDKRAEALQLASELQNYSDLQGAANAVAAAAYHTLRRLHMLQ